MSLRAQLVPLDGGTAIELVKDMNLVGRQADCEVRIESKSISKLHAVLVKTDGLVLVRDLGSTNGTRVNGTRVRRAVLLPNDKLSIANFHYRILFGAALAPLEEEYTQQIDEKDLRKVRSKAADADSGPDHAIVEVRANPLPDVYPEEKK